MAGFGGVLVLLLVLLHGLVAAHANTDLASLVPDAPSADWIEASATPTVLDGEFTASSYAAYLGATSSTPSHIDFYLNLYGFRDGYAREWQQRATDDLLIERVFEFGDSRGAGYWYRDLKLGAQTLAQYTSDIPAAATIPNSFGVKLTYTDAKQWRVEFVKGNLVFVVHTDSGNGDDLAAIAVSQATLEYNSAPSSTVNTAAAAKPLLPQSVLIAAGAVFVFIALAALATAFIVARRGRRSPGRVFAQSGVQMSPDGAFWWDGADWRHAGTDPPPSAQRSPDGAYWWDGTTWRRIFLKT